MKTPVIGIAWSKDGADITGIKTVFEAAGGTAVALPKIVADDLNYAEDGTVGAEALDGRGALSAEAANLLKRRDFSRTNLEAAMRGIDGVFFPGGVDISPNLFAVPQPLPESGIDLNPTRDVSDYLLMAYCMSKDIPNLSVCRGEQMLGVVAGCGFVQDIASELHIPEGAHRDPERKHCVRHAVEIIDKDSILYRVVGADTLENIHSWHHQSVGDCKGTPMTVTARTVTDGVEIVEAIECKTLRFCLGLQFHPESDAIKALFNQCPEETKCDYDICIGFFRAMIEACL